MSVLDYVHVPDRLMPVDLDAEHRRRVTKQDQMLAVEKTPRVIDFDLLERQIVNDPEREHAAAFLQLTYGAVISMCRRIEGKSQNMDYDEDVAKLAEKMYRAAMSKMAEDTGK